MFWGFSAQTSKYLLNRRDAIFYQQTSLFNFLSKLDWIVKSSLCREWPIFPYPSGCQLWAGLLFFWTVYGWLRTSPKLPLDLLDQNLHFKDITGSAGLASSHLRLRLVSKTQGGNDLFSWTYLTLRARPHVQVLLFHCPVPRGPCSDVLHLSSSALPISSS